MGAIDQEATLENAAQAADLIYLAQPIDRILQTLEVVGQFARPNCLITDAGSTKTAIVDKAAEHLPKAVFLGGHPMAGKEQSGAEAADPKLFCDRPYILTPFGPLSDAALQFKDWLTRMQVRILEMSPHEHDSVVALTSHLPQLVSTAISLTLSQQGKPEILEAFGPGLIDMTRLAISSHAVWKSILETNRGEIVKALDQVFGDIGRAKECCGAGFNSF